MPYLVTISLQGHSASDKTTLNLDIGEPADHLAAQSAVTQIVGALDDVTKATIRKVMLTEIISEDGTRPVDTSADTFEECAIATYLNDALDQEKLHTVRIPAPIDAMFLNDAQTLDTANALVIQYVQQLSQHAFVSDGEQINDAIDDGIKYGYKRSKARNFRT
jgi:LPS O-antigen subunit length determinant protein (WzzB/FepE family)